MSCVTIQVMSTTHSQPVGDLLREWRQRRRMSQLDFACEADVSTRHLSFLETGRSLPSREMLLHLADRLEIPLRERNVLLIAAGYAPMFPERALDDPALLAARKAIDLVLAGHAPFPALAIDRHWTVVASNRIVPLLFKDIHPGLMQPPVNVLRVSLHPEGLGSRIANFEDWRTHILARVRRQIDISADPLLVELLQEISAYPRPAGAEGRLPISDRLHAEVAVPFQLRSADGLLSFFTTTMMFGTPVDITLSELAIESFFPADAATAEAMHRLANG